MAEVTGYIGNEFVNFENAATESTLKELLAVTKRMVRSSEEIKKLDREIKKLHKQIDQTQKSSQKLEKTQDSMSTQVQLLADTYGRSLDTFKQHTKQTHRSTGTLRTFTGVISTTANKFVDVSKDLAGMGDSLSSATGMFAHLPIVGGFVSKVFGEVVRNSEKLVASFQRSAAVGATFGGSVQSMVASASQVGLTFDQFSTAIATAAPGLALLGDGVESGAKQFTELSKQMRVALTRDNLANLGFTTESANQAIASFINRMARSGVAQRMTTEQLSESSTRYLRNLDALSRLTGESRDALQAQQDALQNEAKFRQFLSQIDEDSATQLGDLLTAIPAGELRTGLMELITTGAAQSEAAQRAMAFLPQVSRDALMLGRSLEAGGTLTQDSMTGLANQFRASAAELQQSPLGDTLAKFVPELNEFMSAVIPASRRAENFQTLFEQQQEALSQIADQTATTLLDAQQRLSEVSNNMAASISRFLPEVADLTLFFVEPLGDALGYVLDNLKEWTSEGGFFESLTNGFNGVVDLIRQHVVDALAESTLSSGLLQGLLAALAGGALGAVVGGSRSSGGSAERPRGRSAGGRNIGMLGGLLSGIIGGTLTGIAIGLRAFANPAVLKGAGILAASITVIGAAIGAAAWLSGAGLSTLADGLKNLTTVDAEKLSAVGLSMKDLGEGLVYMAGGRVVGALSGIAELPGRIAQFFGADSPMERLQSSIEGFANLSIDTNRITAVSYGLETFVDSMAVVSSDAFIQSLNSLSRIDTGGFFSAAPLEKLARQVQTYQSMRLNNSQIERTAEGLRTFVHSISELGSVDVSLDTAFDFRSSVRGLESVNKELEKYISNLKEVDRQSSSSRGLWPFNRSQENTETTSAAAVMPENTESVQNLVNTLSNKLDQLIEINESINSINDRQLRELRSRDPLFSVP